MIETQHSAEWLDAFNHAEGRFRPIWIIHGSPGLAVIPAISILRVASSITKNT
jgi:hypothetical protein